MANNRLGEIRRSAAVMTFGPGSVADSELTARRCPPFLLGSKNGTRTLRRLVGPNKFQNRGCRGSCRWAAFVFHRSSMMIATATL